MEEKVIEEKNFIIICKQTTMLLPDGQLATRQEYNHVKGEAKYLSDGNILVEVTNEDGQSESNMQKIRKISETMKEEDIFSSLAPTPQAKDNLQESEPVFQVRNPQVPQKSAIKKSQTNQESKSPGKSVTVKLPGQERRQSTNETIKDRPRKPNVPVVSQRKGNLPSKSPSKVPQRQATGKNKDSSKNVKAPVKKQHTIDQSKTFKTSIGLNQHQHDLIEQQEKANQSKLYDNPELFNKQKEILKTEECLPNSSFIKRNETQVRRRRPRKDNKRRAEQKNKEKVWDNWVITSFIPTMAKMKHRMAVKKLKSSVSFIAKQNSKFQELCSFLQENKMIYNDIDFPPEFKSLWGFGDNKHFYDQKEWQDFIWCRPSVIFRKKDKYQVFADDIEPNDIDQGGLGDCYFLSSLASISRFQNRIKKLFLTREVNDELGCYCMAICVNGMWEEVIIDDMFPCLSNSKRPAFNSTTTAELWVMLLEKAWAKIHGGYLNIVSGTTREALHDLTGAPTASFFNDTEDREFHWQQLVKAEQNRYVLTASTYSKKKMIRNGLLRSDEDSIQKYGLVVGHAYSILGIYELCTNKQTNLVHNHDLMESQMMLDDSERVRLVKLRNPWAHQEWNGEFSMQDKSSWVQGLKEFLKIEDKNDGIFVMPFRDFLTYFSHYEVCYFKDEYELSSMKYKTVESEDEVVISFEVVQAGEYYISLHQINDRFFPQSDNYDYSPLRLVLVKVDRNNSKGNTLTYIDGIIEAKKEMWLKHTFQPGEYIAYVETFWNSKNNEFTVSAYGPGQVEFEELDETDQDILLRNERHLCFIEEVVYQRAKFNYSGETQTYPEVKIEDIFRRQELLPDGYGYYYFNNENSKYHLIIKLDMRQSENIELCDPYKALEAQIDCPVGQDQIMVYRCTECSYHKKCIYSSVFKSDKSLQKVVDKGAKTSYKAGKEDSGVNSYQLDLKDSSVIYFENLSENLFFKGDMVLSLKNGQIQGVVEGKDSEREANLQIRLLPGMCRTVYIGPRDKKAGHEFSVKSIDFEFDEL